MIVFFEHIRDKDHYVRSILSDVKKPTKTLTAEQQLQHAAVTTCELCHGSFKMNKRRNVTAILVDITSVHTAIYASLNWNTKKGPNSDPTTETKNKSVKRKQKSSQCDIQKIHKKAEDVARDNDDLDTADYLMTANSFMIPLISFTIWRATTRIYAIRSQLSRCYTNHIGEICKIPNRQSSLHRQFAISPRLPRHTGPKLGCGWQR